MVPRLAAASINCKLGQANSQARLANQNCLDQVFGLINSPGDSDGHPGFRGHWSLTHPVFLKFLDPQMGRGLS